MRVRTAAISFLILAWANANADPHAVLGRWKTVDQESGDVRSVVELYLSDERLYGRVVRVFSPPVKTPDPICTKCSGARKDKRINGMIIIEGLRREANHWAGGTVLDPSTGGVYDAVIWRERDVLKVRGYRWLFFKTQTWYPDEAVR